MSHEVRVQHREPALVMAKRLPVRLADIGRVLGTAFGEVYGHLGAHGGDPDGPPFVIYHGMPAGNEPFDIEVCAPVQHAIDPPFGWAVTVTPRRVVRVTAARGSVRLGPDRLRHHPGLDRGSRPGRRWPAPGRST